MRRLGLLALVATALVACGSGGSTAQPRGAKSVLRQQRAPRADPRKQPDDDGGCVRARNGVAGR